MKILRWLIILSLFQILISGCGKSNEQAPPLSRFGNHPDTWQVDHRIAFRKAPGQCQECHGLDLKGGISKVDCFNQGGLSSCHTNGHGPRVHAFPYEGAIHKNDIGPLFGSPNTFIQRCGPCHDYESTTGAYPVPQYTPPACAGCHNRGNGVGNGCASCHGDWAGRPDSVFYNTTGNTYTKNAFPNNAGLHNSITWHVVECAVCHAGGGAGTLLHGDSNRVLRTRADVIIRFTTSTSAATVTGMTVNRTSSPSTCTGECHSKRNGVKYLHSHTNAIWQ